MPHPEKCCDLVMKGGITSGVVYPHAVVELARDYRFQNIGGTSAGAIAAVVTAAAEFGRDQGGFDKVASLPEDLAATLMEKFQPRPVFRPLFATLLAGLKGKPSAILATLLQGYAGAALTGALPGVAVLLFFGLPGWSWGFLWLGLVLAVLGALAGALWGAFRTVTRDLPAHDFGLCSGLTEAGASGPALTDWLTDMIDTAAGRPTDGAPLTTAELTAAGITVNTVTTDITTHRPFSLPMRNNLYFFSESEFRQLFPARVVNHMIATSARVTEKGQPVGTDLYYFKNDQMPLVVIARMSLSFPGLIAAVPLWRFDRTLVNGTDALVRCLFSDGGISSNFPVHFFDAFLPHTPTFGISLGEYDPRRVKPGQEAASRVKLPLEATQGQLLPTHGIGGVIGFVMALFNSAKDWQDSLQSILPGYRERIVTINLTESEGGMNLDMPPELIVDLSGLGREAGAQIARSFSLDEHRWRRFLVELRAASEMLEDFADGYDGAPQPGATAYPALATGYAPVSFKQLSQDDRAHLKARAEKIAAVGRELKAMMPLTDLDDKLPKSRSRLRNVPRMDS